MSNRCLNCGNLTSILESKNICNDCHRVGIHKHCISRSEIEKVIKQNKKIVDDCNDEKCSYCIGKMVVIKELESILEGEE